ncbi:YT521-B-like domain-containing protein [Cytidiella melzeri]|nr:YT521-B-like domain-containing protein [Cytidiella melzeri]
MVDTAHIAQTKHRPDHYPTSPALSPLPSPTQTMRATFPPAPTRPSTSVSPPSTELDLSTPRRNVLTLSELNPPHSREDSGPVLYDSAASRIAPSSPSSSSSSSESIKIGAGPTLSRDALRSFGSAVHDLYSPSAHSPNTLFNDSFQAAPDFFDYAPERHQSGVFDTAASEAVEPLAKLNMNASDSSGKPPFRGRSYSNTSRRGPPGRQSQQPPPQAFGPPVGYFQDQPQGFPGQYQTANPPYAQRGPFVPSHAQYAMAPAANMAHQQPGGAQYAYPSHPGLHAPDTSMHPQNQLLGYTTNTMVPILQPHYSYTGHSPSEAGSSSNPMGGLSYSASSAATTPAVYSSAHNSPTSHTPSQALTQSYGAHSPYGAARFPTPPFMYPPASFTHSGNTMYQSPFSYGQQYRPAMTVPAEQDSARGQGTWWYLPPGTRPAPSPHYDAYVPQPYPMYSPIQSHDVDSYGQTQSSSSTAHYPTVSSRAPPQHQPFPSSHLPPPLSQQQPEPPPPPFYDVNAISRSASEPARSEAASSSSVFSRAPGRFETPAPPSAARRPYHPNPPANRSEWVMWAGNVPSDATHDELWRFFNRSSSPAASSSSSASAPLIGAGAASLSALSSPAEPASTVHGGVSSIFLISRSNCAFVNFASEQHLHAAIARFNGQPLRPNDPRCPRLVCRVRAREDDLKAGVGGQRGSGIHVKWVKEQRAKAKTQQAQARAAGSPEASSSERSIVTPSSNSPVDAASSLMRSLSLSSADDLATTGGGSGGMPLRRVKKASGHSNSSESYASTSSSMLQQHFPKRYFILKSLSQFDLDLSVEQGVWATQKHNEGILDQAYRTSKDVYLIFGVNKSGEFYGYARMAGPVLKGHGEPGSDRRVSWASRSSIDPTQARRSTTGGPSSPSATRKPYVPYFSPSDGPRYEDSPLPMEEKTEGVAVAKPNLNLHSISAPAVMLDPHNPLSSVSNGPRYGERSYDPVLPAVPSMLRHSQTSEDEFQLDPHAPDRAIKHHSADDVETDSSGVKRWDAAPRVSETSSLGSVREEEEEMGEPGSLPDMARAGPGEPSGQGEEAGVQKKEDGPVWGESFRVEWIKTTRLPFYRTRQFRNPWNHDREVKVSRDGTELEPSVGQALLDEWEKPEPSPPSQPPHRSGTKSSPPDVAPGREEGPG